MQPTTETVLAENLEQYGFSVDTYSPREIFRYLRRERWPIELIHVHHPGRLTSLLSMIGAKEPIVYTPHRTNLPPRILLAMGHKRMIAKTATRVIALSPNESEHLKSKFRVSDARSFVIPNGFRLPDISPHQRARPCNGEKWRLLFVGQLLPVKRPWLLIEMLSEIKSSFDVELVLVSQNAALLSDLMATARQLGVDGRVHFRGQLSPRRLAVEYSSAHCLLLPSAAEALPSVITESLRSGLPVVASDVGGVRWQLDGTGSCVEVRDASDLTIAVRDVLTNFEHYSWVSGARSVEVSARFTEEEMVRSHAVLYDSLIQGVFRNDRFC